MNVSLVDKRQCELTIFDGPTGWLAGKAMVRMNASSEREAVARLRPVEGDRVLVIGFGPGVGLQALLSEPVARVVGADPSEVMCKLASKRNAHEIKTGRLVLLQHEVAVVDPIHGPFDGMIAVNTMQMCRPIGPTAERLALLLREGGKLITLTHAWAAENDFGSASTFADSVRGGLLDAGFSEVTIGKGDTENGSIILIGALR